MPAAAFNVGHRVLLENDASSADLRVLIIAGASFPSDVKDLDLDSVADVLAVSGVVEAAATGYSRTALPGLAIAVDDANDRAVLSWNDIVFTTPAVGETWRGAIVYLEGASDAARSLVFYDEFASPLPTNGQNITYQGGEIRSANA